MRGKEALRVLCRGTASGGAPGRRFEFGEILPFQFQGFGQLLHSVTVRAPPFAALEQPDGLGSEARPSGQVFLGWVLGYGILGQRAMGRILLRRLR